MSTNSDDNWGSILGLVAELKRCDDAEITTASLAMAFICIDTLSGLARPIKKDRVTRADFKSWVDKHLKAHADQPYKYRGKDVYAARCAFLHNYGSEANLHKEDPNTIKYGYHDGGEHKYDKSVDPTLAIIGVKSFVNDVVIAVESFLEECQKEPSLKRRVEHRLIHVLQTKPISS